MRPVFSRQRSGPLDVGDSARVSVLALLILLLLPAAGAAFARDAAQDPVFIARAEPLRLAFGTEVLGIQLQALTLGTEAEEAEEADEAEGEEAEELEVDPLALFMGSLQAADPGLAMQLEDTLAEVENLAKKPGDERLARAVQETQGLLDRARDALVPQELQDDPVFAASLMARIALGPFGPGEGYEEAAHGEEGAYQAGWAALRRLEAIWAEVEPNVGADASKVTQAFADFGALMPTAEPPERFRDPEDAETAAQDLAFGLEAATGQTLFPHDFQTALVLVEREAQAACDSYGAAPLAAERALSAYVSYRKHVANSLAFIMPDLHQQIDTLLGTELPEDVQGGRGAADTCAELREALAKAGGR